MKIIKITRCFEKCPHCTGPDWNREVKKMQFTCQKIPEWIENENTIPEFCPLEDAPLHKNQAVGAEADNGCVFCIFSERAKYNFCTNCGTKIRST